MSRHIVQVDAARRDRSLVPSSQSIENKLKAEPVLLVWRRLIDLAAEEAKRVRFGEPTDTAIWQRWWITVPDVPVDAGREFRATFPRCCLFLGIDTEVERARLIGEIDAALEASARVYMAKKLELRRRAVLAVAGCEGEMRKTYALLLISQVEYEDTAGINRADPPARVRRLDRTAKAAA
jgi:hypothetical protein